MHEMRLGAATAPVEIMNPGRRGLDKPVERFSQSIAIHEFDITSLLNSILLLLLASNVKRNWCSMRSIRLIGYIGSVGLIGWCFRGAPLVLPELTHSNKSNQ
jgi:hypothetical protein